MSSKNFNLGRSEALNGVFFRVDDAVNYLKSLPAWRGYEDLDEAEFRLGWTDASLGIGDAIGNVDGYSGKFNS